MHTRSKLIFAALTATLLMGIAVGTASANRLKITSQNFRVVWRDLKFFGGTSEVHCPVTLEGSFHSATIEKVIGALIGYVSRASVGAAAVCTGGRATILQETLPWHVSYQGFTGRLPNIETIRVLLRRTRFVIEVNGGFGTTCLYGEDGTGNRERTAGGEIIREANGGGNTLRADNTIRLNLLRRGGIGGFACPETGGFEGEGEVTQLGSTTRITVTLI